MNQMNTPVNREEFERNILLLVESIKRGKLRLPQGSKNMSEFKEIRKLPNGRIDMLSINEMARLSANMIATMADSSSFARTQEFNDPD